MEMLNTTIHITMRVVFLALLCCAAGVCSAQPLDSYLHKNAFLDTGPNLELFKFQHKPISSRQAASFAFEYLKRKGTTSIVVCEVLWIAAPLGGYLVDAKGKSTIDGATYTIFRVGVRDGTEQKDGKALAGEVFVFLALGKDKSGKLYWHPSPGPDASWEDGVTEGMLAYEFLLGREKFVALDKRYR